jgi:hypothetical protein
MSTSIRAMRRRTLAACVATLFATAWSGGALAFAPAPAAAGEAPRAPAAASSGPSPHTPAVIDVTNCDDSGPGSLRDAVSNAASGDVIDMTQLTCSRITLTTGAILLGQDDIGLQGPGPNRLSIDGSGSQGEDVLYHLGTGTVHVDGLTIENGSKYTSAQDARGGCIHSAGNVDVQNSVVRLCLASAPAPYHVLGGAIYSYGGTLLVRARVVDSQGFDPGSYASGGGVYALGGFNSVYAQISGDSLVGSNSWGGGVFARGPVFIANTEISGNLANHIAGAALEDNTGYVAFMVNSTVSGNVASSTVGGVDARPPIYMYSSTVAFNSEQIWNDGNGHYFGAGLNVASALSTVYSSILSNNTAPGVGTPGDIFDLSGNAAGVGGADDIIMEFNIGIPASSDRSDPELGPLQDNGGPTRTQRPASSTAGFGDNVTNAMYDQRGPGFPRITSDGVTIGAYEWNPDVIFINGFN